MTIPRQTFDRNRPQYRRAVGLLTAVALGLTGCGTKDLASPILDAELNIAKFCQQGGGPNGARAVRQLTALLRDNGNPKTRAAVDGPTRPLKAWVTDAANELDDCGPQGQAYARRLDRILKNG